jgi:tRNA 5-methylaminomethyl-2-thiouridine biosynthesis bifunctional protein
MKLRPALITREPGGAPFAPDYGDVYANRAGAAAQARHVFLAGSGLPARWAHRAEFVVLENGFGLGANFLATLAAWRADPARCARLHYVALEAHPPSAAQLVEFADPELASLAAQLAARWPLPLPGLHRIEFDDGRVVLTLALGEAQTLAPRLALGFDALYLDGFAPERNPAMWEPGLVKSLARLARPDATAATWCTARVLKDALAEAGFAFELRPGYAGKREMLAARYAPRWASRRHEPPCAYRGGRRALVIGAGLAGSLAARALAARGWTVQVLDAGPVPGSGASALAWGLLHPQVSADDNRLARLTRAGCAAALRALPAGDASLVQRRGVFQIAQDEAELEHWRAIAAALELPAEHARLVEGAQAQPLLGLAPRRGGWWFAQGALVAAGRWCRHALAAPGVQFRGATEVASLAQREGEWCALDAAGRVLAQAPVAILANAADAPELAGLAHAPVAPVRGRISLLAEHDLAGLRAGLAGDGYAVRGGDGWVGVGASYERGPEAVPAERVHAGNLQRLARLLADPPVVLPVGFYAGVRAVSRDRLPLVGPVADEAAALAQPALRGARLHELPRLPGLHAAFGFGSRGLALAALAAELLAAQIEGEPWPIETDLAASLDPARFLAAHLRRQG